MKVLLIVILSIIALPALANPYVEFKNELPFKGSDSQDDINHLRLGYKLDNNLYFEAGPRTDGYSFETGYKFKFDNFTFKGKFEGSDTDSNNYLKSKLETEIRYTF